MQSLFQYSLHKEEQEGICDIEKNHTEYLAPDHKDHREDLIKKMIEDIDLSKGGTVLVYNQTFEKTRLKELARMFPKYKKELVIVLVSLVLFTAASTLVPYFSNGFFRLVCNFRFFLCLYYIPCVYISNTSCFRAHLPPSGHTVQHSMHNSP